MRAALVSMPWEAGTVDSVWRLPVPNFVIAVIFWFAVDLRS